MSLPPVDRVAVTTVYLVPQHCTGAEALVRLAQRMGRELVVSSTGSTFTFGGQT